LRVEADLAAGRHGEVVPELQRLVDRHPWREHLHAQLMLALYRSGRQADALETYRRAREVLVEELGIEPGSELHELHQKILDHAPALDLPVRVAGRRTALPVPPNRTIGREREVAVLVERIRADSARLITLTGPGGVGKTRLALETARAAEADFDDGAAFVPLAAVSRPRDVAPAMMGALGSVPLAGESAEQAVERFLAAKRLLLVVDNCEHLPGAAPFIGGLPLTCPGLTVLATSREPLHVQAEQRHPVPPLALPGAGADPAAGSAVALFHERARAHVPELDLGADARAVADICRRLDGLPLAIELAAARCELLSPAELVERLDGALGPGPRDAPSRHQTLRATIDWSYDLLDDVERECLARFAAFSGGATLDAAEIITGAGIETLDRLVAKSLLVRRQVSGRSRLGMLETVRAYAAERFAHATDADVVRERHYRFFRALAGRHASREAVVGPNRPEHLARLDDDVGNLLAALEWAADRDTAEPLLALCALFGEYCLGRGRFADAVTWGQKALELPGAEREPELCVRVLCLMGWALWPLGRSAEIPRVRAEARALAEAEQDPALLSQVLLETAAGISFAGEYEAASALADAALPYAEATGDPGQLAMVAWARALAEADPAALTGRVERAAALLDEAGNAFHLAAMYHVVGNRALNGGSDRAALEYCRRAVPLVRELESTYELLLLSGNLGLAELLNGGTEAAGRAFRAQLELVRELGVLPAAFQGLRGVAAVTAVRGDLDRAARLAGAAAAHRYGENPLPVDARVGADFLEPARDRLSADAWDAAACEGEALSFEEAIAFALDE
jgi:predicted ATPase